MSTKLKKDLITPPRNAKTAFDPGEAAGSGKAAKAPLPELQGSRLPNNLKLPPLPTEIQPVPPLVQSFDIPSEAKADTIQGSYSSDDLRAIRSPHNPFTLQPLPPKDTKSNLGEWERERRATEPGQTSEEFDLGARGAGLPGIPSSSSPSGAEDTQPSSSSSFSGHRKKNNHEEGSLDQPSNWRVVAITWNMANKSPPESLDEMFRWTCGGDQPASISNCDICIIGVQEAHDLEKWEKLLHAGLNNGAHGDFDCVQKVRLDPGGWIHMAVFVRHSVLPSLSGVRKASVSTGIGNVIGNKGAVGVSFYLEGVRCCFINAHFQAHTHNIEARNQDYDRICSELFSSPIHRVGSSKSLSSNGVETITASSGDLTENHDVVIFLGDLNYRVESNRAAADLLIQDGMLEVMRANDQLLREKAKGRVFKGFKEGPLDFPPTYKFNTQSDQYDTSEKKRVPSWTDRILYLCPETSDGTTRAEINLNFYGSINSVKTSDHRPVVSSMMLTRLQTAKDFPQALYLDSASRACSIQ